MKIDSGTWMLIDTKKVLATTFVRSALWFETIESTNTFLLQQNDSHAQPPILVGAERQTAGRGRGANQWWAADGALTFSLLVKPGDWGIPREFWPRLSLATGVAICQALTDLCPLVNFQVKWPNDVYAGGRKLCGILIESPPQQEEQLVIGIGVNVNNSFVDAPDEIRSRALSLVDLLGEPVERTKVLITILCSLNRALTALGESPLEVFRQFRELCFLSGRIITVTDVTGEVTGTCQGIDDDGALRLMTASGPRRLFAGVVSLS